MAQLRQKFTHSHLPVHMLDHMTHDIARPQSDQIATQLWLPTGEVVLRLHVLDVSLFSLSLKDSRRKRTESSNILLVHFKDVTDLSTSSDTYLLAILT